MRHILAIPSRQCYKSNMDHVVKCCSILHSMIVEEKDENCTMNTKTIVSEDPLTDVTPIRMTANSLGHYEQAELQLQTTYLAEDESDPKILSNALADSIWK